MPTSRGEIKQSNAEALAIGIFKSPLGVAMLTCRDNCRTGGDRNWAGSGTSGFKPLDVRFRRGDNLKRTAPADAGSRKLPATYRLSHSSASLSSSRSNPLISRFTTGLIFSASERIHSGPPTIAYRSSRLMKSIFDLAIFPDASNDGSKPCKFLIRASS